MKDLERDTPQPNFQELYKEGRHNNGNLDDFLDDCVEKSRYLPPEKVYIQIAATEVFKNFYYRNKNPPCIRNNDYLFEDEMEIFAICHEKNGLPKKARKMLKMNSNYENFFQQNCGTDMVIKLFRELFENTSSKISVFPFCSLLRTEWNPMRSTTPKRNSFKEPIEFFPTNSDKEYKC